MGIVAAIAALFGSSCAKHNVHVEFVNERDNALIGTVDLPLEKLPDTFAVDTTLDIADKKWSVIRAEPVTKPEFAKSSRLRVFLLPITTVPPGELLYSLPTISNDIGVGEGSAPPDDRVFQIHEDDWRQIEFVSQEYEQEIQSEFNDIRKVYDSRHPGGGFVKVHVRKRVPTPLRKKAIRISDLQRELPPKRNYVAVGIQRSLGTFQNSFAWDIDDDVTLWGTRNEEGRIQILCLTLRGNNSRSLEWIAALARLCSKHALCIVDWCRVSKASNSLDIKELFEQ